MRWAIGQGVLLRCTEHASIGVPSGIMRTTINLDEQLIEEAQRITGTTERTALIHEGLRALIARESARRLARLGGSDRRAAAPRRRRPS
jgi:Arc/MetJ family transcription regulator